MRPGLLRMAFVAALAVAALTAAACSQDASTPTPVATPTPDQTAAAATFTANNLETGQASGFLRFGISKPASEFTLKDQNGKTVSLQDFRGKWVLVDWIYTSCMTVCPVLTANMKSVQAGLGEKLGTQVQMVTITFDPERDTVEKMRTYAQAAHADVDGWSWLTGTKGQTDAVAAAYGVSYTPSEPMMGMAMYDHTALVVLIDENGQEHDRYFGVGWSADLLERLDSLLAAAQPTPTAIANPPTAASARPTATSGSAGVDADLEALAAGSTVFHWEPLDLPNGVQAQAMYQFPTATKAVAYYHGLLSATALDGWETVQQFNETADGPTSVDWNILQTEDRWAAVGGGKSNVNLVFDIRAEWQAALIEAIAGIEGSSICCFP